MKAKIWVIAPFGSMQEVTHQVTTERSIELANCDITVSTSHCDVTGFQESLIELQKAKDWGAEAIISRGGTAAYVAAHSDIPVVEIEVTALDILRALRKFGEKESSKICIAGFKNTIYECESLTDFLGTRLRQVAIIDDADFDGMKQAVSDGATALVGDALCIRFATMNRIPGYLIESGKASIYKAIREAESVVKVRRKEQSRAEMLRTIIDSSPDGILAIDDSALISLCNKAAEELFRIDRHQIVGRPVVEMIPNTRMHHVLQSGQAEIGEVQKIDSKQIATSRIPIIASKEVTGVVATFQEVSQLQNFEQSIRRKLHDKGLTAKFHLEQIIGDSPAIKKAKDLALTYATSDSTVMITGESGTGKELFAQSIHNLSARRNAPFVAVNCAALPEQLLESELFGYEEGAFSGAKKGGKIGLVELAHNGTLFLDEIGDMPLTLQARLLRMIQEKEVMRLGGHKIIPVNVRILVATNQDLTTLMASNRFREDLYYRLNVLPLHLPPLRERLQDICPLVEHLVEQFSEKFTVTSISEEAKQALKEHPWLGNVRELRNVIERMVLLSPGSIIEKTSVENVLLAASRTNTAKTRSDMWSLVDEFRKTGMGARKIAKILGQKGYEVKYYQIAYYLDKRKKVGV